MRIITEDEFRTSVEPIYNRIFINDDAYNSPFHSKIQPRLLLFAYHWGLDEPWLIPFAKALKLTGEDGFYLTATKRPALIKAQPNHWYIPLEEADRYAHVIASQENAIYSTTGKWGIICSDEAHALLGGSKVLVKEIREYVPDLDERVLRFISMWKTYHERNKVSIDWLPGMLIHIYGYAEASKLLQHSDLAWLLENKPE